MINKNFLKNKNISPGKNATEYLILHHTGAIGDGNINTLSGRVGNVSCHYLVRQNGAIYQFVDEDKIAWHCGMSKYKDKTNLNRFSIGIEVESDGKTFTQKQIEATDKLVLDIYTRLGCHILRHKDITTRKIDIGDSFRNKRFKTFDDYVLSIKNNKIMSKFETIFKKEVKGPIFNSHDGDSPLTEKETKHLLEIAIKRNNEKLYKRILTDLKVILKK